jgi:hypothetical protein
MNKYRPRYNARAELRRWRTANRFFKDFSRTGAIIKSSRGRPVCDRILVRDQLNKKKDPLQPLLIMKRLIPL